MTYQGLLQWEGFEFDIHEWETPTKGKYNIDKIQRAAQNIAEVHVAARYLHKKAVTALSAAPAVRMVAPPPPAPIAAAIVPEAVEVADAVAELRVRCYHIQILVFSDKPNGVGRLYAQVCKNKTAMGRRIAHCRWRTEAMEAL